jgi:CRISPR system Cascade subunit CasE
MSYFSLVELRRSPEAWRQLRDFSGHGDAYRDHCLIWKLFPGDRHDRDFLFRRRQQPGDLSYYVVSQRPPESAQRIFKTQTKVYRPELAVGERVRFELQANPVVSRKYGEAPLGERRRSKRHDVLMDAKWRMRSLVDLPGGIDYAVEEAALAWLGKQAGRWGLRIEPQSVLTNAYTQHSLKAKGRPIQFSSLDFCGVAEVTQPALLSKALLGGVGHARAFGCGLLLVRRVA